MHPDHLHLPTLTKYVQKDTTFLVPRFQSGSVERVLREAGFRNVVAVDFLEELQIESESGMRLKALILKSGDDRDDSSLLLFTRDTTVLFGVDTNMPNRWVLPKVDVLFTPFAGGASGFPAMIENLTRREKRLLAERNRLNDLQMHVAQLLRITSPRIVVPYAGYFTVLGRDQDVDDVNTKNTRQQALEFIGRRAPSSVCVDPITNGHFRVKGAEINYIEYKEPAPTPIDAECIQEDIDRFSSGMPELSAAFLDALGQQFIDSGFTDVLTAVIVPCSDDFEPAVDMYLTIDFSNDRRGYSIVHTRAASSQQLAATLRAHTQNNIEVLSVRHDSLRGVIGRGLPLEDLSIGFQVRMFREPNVYNFRFWDYFTNTRNIRVDPQSHVMPQKQVAGR